MHGYERLCVDMHGHARLFIHPSGTFWDKSSDGQLLWLRNMTSWIAGGQANFGWKYMFFQLLSTIKVNLLAKIMQSAYIYNLIVHVKHKILPFLAVLTCFLILGKIQDGGQDNDHCWWRHRPSAAPPPLKHTSSCWEDQRLSTKGKIALKYSVLQHIKNSGNWFYSPPPLVCTIVGVSICVYVQGLTKDYMAILGRLCVGNQGFSKCMTADYFEVVVPYSSTLRQFHLNWSVGWKRM